MKKWEYDVEYSGTAKGLTDAMAQANEKGADGWELFHIEGNSVQGYRMLFKREKPAEEPREFTGRGKSSGRR